MAENELRAETSDLTKLLDERATFKSRLELIERVSREALEKGAAFGSELRLAQRIVAICEGKL